MKWVTSKDVRVGRVAAAWLIRRFVDPDAELLFVPGREVREVAERENAIGYHVPGFELGKAGNRTAFEVILQKYDPNDKALNLLAQFVNAADTDNTTYNRREGPGLKVVIEGFRDLPHADDMEIVDAASPVFDALYAYCRKQVGV